MWPFSSSSSSSSTATSVSAGTDRSVAVDLAPPTTGTTTQSAPHSQATQAIPTASGPRLNIPSGNSPISEPSSAALAEDKLSGDKWTDYKSAFQRIRVGEDIQHIGEIPCARSSLLYGIGGGSAIGAVRYLGSRSPKAGANWAVMGFVVIALTQWEMCNRARAKELAQMRVIQERFPHRHVSTLKKIEPGAGGQPS